MQFMHRALNISMETVWEHASFRHFCSTSNILSVLQNSLQHVVVMCSSAESGFWYTLIILRGNIVSDMKLQKDEIVSHLWFGFQSLNPIIFIQKLNIGEKACRIRQPGVLEKEIAERGLIRQQ